MKSEKIDALAAALCKVQSKLKPAIKNKKNPFFKSDYADLVSVLDASRALLSENGLCVIQTTGVSESGSPELVTTLAHSSGQWIEGRYPLNAKANDPQGVGSAVTYARRYAFMAIVGVVSDEDDDGEAAQARGNGKKEIPQSKPKLVPEKEIASDSCPDCGSEGRVSKFNESEMYCSDYKNGCKAKWAIATRQ